MLEGQRGILFPSLGVPLSEINENSEPTNFLNLANYLII